MSNEHNPSGGKVQFDEVVRKMPDYLGMLNECPCIGMDSTRERRNLRAELLRNANVKVIEGSKPKTGPGIYVLYERGEAMYAGRTNHLPERLLAHGNQGGSETATFAFLMAREEYQKKHPGNGLTRGELTKLTEFESLFDAARKRVRKMIVKAVGIDDPIEQTLFEVYAHLLLGTRYNSFDNH